MENLDLSGVAPVRWQEMRRRVAALRRFVAINEPSVAEHAAAAAEAGLGIDHFDRLARSWRIHQDPARLNGAGTLNRQKRSRCDGVGKEVQTIIARAIKRAGPEAAPKDVYDLVRAECAARNLRVPSNNRVWMKLMNEKAEAGPLPGGSPEILIGRVWADLPAIGKEGSSRLVRPELLLAVALPDRTIVEQCSDLKTGRPPVFEDLDLSSQKGIALRVAARDMRLPGFLDEGVHLEIDDSANARLARILGRSVANLQLVFRLPKTPADRLLKNALDRPLSPADAELAIDYAIARHNDHVNSLVA